MNVSATIGEPDFHDRVASRIDALSPRERTITDYLLTHPSEAVTATAAELAATTGTSDASVVRTARSLGYSGLRDLKRSLLEMMTASRDPARMLDQRLEHIEGDRVFESVISDAQDVLQRLPQSVEPDAFGRAVALVQQAPRTLVYGVGPAEAAARHLEIELQRAGRRCAAWTATGFRLADDLLDLSDDDVVVVLAPLRLFREIDVLLARAREVGAKAIVVTEALGPALNDRADTVITTPTSTDNAAGEMLGVWVLTQAIAMHVAASDRTGSVTARQRLNALRQQILGTGLDTDLA